MLTFFRKIRKSLLSSGEARRYFFYAIGEIALVVIGILIALQINNWNEWRKERNYEIEVVTEIYEGLRADSARLEAWWLPRIENKKNGINRISSYVYEGRIIDDSTLFDAYNDMGQQFLISLNMGPFESLKSKGIEIISDKSLRFWIVDVFESVLPRQLEGLHKMETEHRKFSDETDNLLWSDRITKMPDGTFKIFRKSRSKNILEDERLLQLIRAERDELLEVERRITTINETMKVTLLKLKEFLDKNDIDTNVSTIGSIIGVRGMLSDSLKVRSFDD